MLRQTFLQQKQHEISINRIMTRFIVEMGLVTLKLISETIFAANLLIKQSIGLNQSLD